MMSFDPTTTHKAPSSGHVPRAQTSEIAVPTPEAAGDLAMKILLSATSRREALAAGAAFLLAFVPSPPPALAVGEELAALAPAPVIGSRIDLLLRQRCVRCRAGRWT